MKEYIERAAVLDRLSKVKMDGYGFSQGVQFGVDHAIQCIEEAPAADVAPVRHGRWIEKTICLEDGYIGEVFEETCYCCSNCNHETWDKTPYCPNCGARMDKEDEHETG